MWHRSAVGDSDCNAAEPQRAAARKALREVVRELRSAGGGRALQGLLVVEAVGAVAMAVVAAVAASREAGPRPRRHRPTMTKLPAVAEAATPVRAEAAAVEAAAAAATPVQRRAEAAAAAVVDCRQ